MKTNNIAAALGVAALALVAMVPAQAQTVKQFASLTGSDNTFNYTSGAGGGLALSTAPDFYASLDVPRAGALINNPVNVLFTGLANVGTTAETTDSKGVTSFDQSLSGGNFSITDATSNQLLLSGTFGSADLNGTPGTNQAAVSTNFANVAYTGGLYATNANLALGANPADKFNFQLINVNPLLGVTGGNGGALNSFTSAGNGQFTGAINAPTAVPEPASVVPFAMGGLALLGLMARKSRRSSGAAA